MLRSHDQLETRATLSLPVVQATTVVRARTAYRAKFLCALCVLHVGYSCSALIGYELEDDEKQLQARMERWSEAQLRAEGLALFRLTAQITVRHTTLLAANYSATITTYLIQGVFFDQLVATLRQERGGVLPFHRFSAGDMVLLSSPECFEAREVICTFVWKS